MNLQSRKDAAAGRSLGRGWLANMDHAEPVADRKPVNVQPARYVATVDDEKGSVVEGEMRDGKCVARLSHYWLCLLLVFPPSQSQPSMQRPLPAFQPVTEGHIHGHRQSIKNQTL